MILADAAVLAVALVGAAFLFLANDAAQRGIRAHELAWSVMGGALIVAAGLYALLALAVRGG